MSTDRVTILGAQVSRVTLVQALSKLENWIQRPSDRCRFIVATGFHGIWVAHQDRAFRDIVNSSDLFCPDGIAPVWLSRLRGDPLPERVPGPDLMRAFIKSTCHRSYFYGDTEATLEALQHRLAAESPEHNFVGAYSPPFRPLTAAEDESVVRMINDAKPDVLWVGLGVPKQEQWIHSHMLALKVPVVAGVGAAFSLISGTIRRAPRWVGNAGLEWLWRLGCEPGKLWRRDFLDGPRFIYHALKETREIRSAARSSPYRLRQNKMIGITTRVSATNSEESSQNAR
jgi:N-acetylglucosaminyldiphosphoundecaprenol N-acetyl-beta-D-mannosaminyltransferase